jgi:hypothetical protein
MSAPHREATVRLPRPERRRRVGVWLALVLAFVALGFLIGAITGGGSSSPASVSVTARPQARSSVGAVPDVGPVRSLPTMRRERTLPRSEPTIGTTEPSEPASPTGVTPTVGSTPTVSSPSSTKQLVPTSPSKHVVRPAGGGHKSEGET